MTDHDHSHAHDHGEGGRHHHAYEQAQLRAELGADPVNIEIPPGSPFLARTTVTGVGGTISSFELTPTAIADLSHVAVVLVSGLHRRGIAADKLGRVVRGDILTMTAGPSRWSLQNRTGEYIGSLDARASKSAAKMKQDPEAMVLLVTTVALDSGGDGTDLGGLLGTTETIDSFRQYLPGGTPRFGTAPWQVTPEKLIGSHVIVEISHEDPDGSNPVPEQFHGTITHCAADGIVLSRPGHRSLRLPADLSAFERALPGSYELQLLGIMVRDVDYTAMWTIERHLHDGKYVSATFG